MLLMSSVICEFALMGNVNAGLFASPVATICMPLEVEPVFEGFVIKVEKIFDPRLSFMIAAIVLFLLDVAVRKFKFKWIHEIIRDRKRKKELQ